MPGQEVGTEAELVEKLGVNRSTVREGMSVLEQSGLVSRGAGRKLVVCLPQYKTLATRISRAMILREVTFEELYQTAMILEVGVVEAAAIQADDKDIEDLDANISEAERAIDDPVQLSCLDTAFHALLARIARNRVMELAREPAAQLFFPTAEMICRHVPEGATRMVKAHKHIVHAIRKHDMENARIWVLRHLVDWKKGFERAGLRIDEPIGSLLAKLTSGIG